MERRRSETRAARALTLAAVAAVTLAAALPAAGTSPGRNGALAFEAAPASGAAVLEVLSPGAAKPHAILRAVPYAADAAVSPDGRRVAFAASFAYADNPPPPRDLWTMGIGGEGRSLVATSAGSPVRSPDGRTLAYVKVGAIWLRAAAGGRPRLALRGCPCLSPSFTPDSGRIAYVSHRRRASAGSSSRPARGASCAASAVAATPSGRRTGRDLVADRARHLRPAALRAADVVGGRTHARRRVVAGRHADRVHPPALRRAERTRASRS
jgi:hypothetical protein